MGCGIGSWLSGCSITITPPYHSSLTFAMSSNVRTALPSWDIHSRCVVHDVLEVARLVDLQTLGDDSLRLEPMMCSHGGRF